MTAIHRWLAAGLCAIPLTLIGADGTARDRLPPEVEAARARYQELLDDGIRQRHETLEELRRTYLEHLEHLGEQLRRDGDLDGVLTVRREIDRFEREGEVGPGDIRQTPAGLAALQQRYRAAHTQRNRELMERIVRMSDSFLNALERFEQQLVTGDRIEEALAVRAERETAARHALVREARMTLARLEAAAPPPERPRPEPPPAPATARLPEGIYRPGAEPERDLNPLVMRFTSIRSRAAATLVNADVAMYVDTEDEQGSRRRSSWSTSTSSSGLHTYFPRMTISVPPIHRIDRGTVVFEYFAQPMDGRGAHSRVRTEHIPLPPMAGGDSLIVDGAGVKHYQFQYDFRARGSRYRSSSRRGSTHYGLIASIYDDKGEMLFQRTDRSPLNSEASDTLPPAYNDRRGQVHDTSVGTPRFYHY